MANEEHLKILRQGVEAWNAVKSDNPGAYPDLEEADLRKQQLVGINLSWAVLNGAKLSGANLEDADLSQTFMWSANLNKAKLDSANLSGAVLTDASCRGANLECADLTDATLCRTDLSNAWLSGADLTFAKLNGAKLHKARLSDVSFVNTDLSGAIGLDECVHHGRSFLDWSTIERSGGLPEIFLRGCGWSDWQIEAAKLCQRGLSNGQITDITYAMANKLTSNPFTYYSCFISHSHADKPFARWLHDQLQARGVRCWLDEKQLLPGDDIYRAVDRGIHQYDKFLLCSSRASLTSWWVDNEIATVFAKEQRLMKERGEKLNLLLPLDLDAHLFSEDFQNGKQQQLRERLAADFKGWQPDSTGFSAELDRVVKALRADDGARPQPPPSLLK